MRRDAPLTPSGSEARESLRRELAKPAYADQRSLLERLWDWAKDRLNDLLNGIGNALPLWVLLPALLLLAGGVIIALTRLRHRAGARPTAEADGVLGQITLTADQLRRRADQAVAEGDARSALLDLFRAIARAGEERALLVPRPGRTAREVGAELTPYFSDQQRQLRVAADLFDQVRYGEAPATADDVAQLRSLDEQLTRSRPRHGATTGAPT